MVIKFLVFAILLNPLKGRLMFQHFLSSYHAFGQWNKHKFSKHWSCSNWAFSKCVCFNPVLWGWRVTCCTTTTGWSWTTCLTPRLGTRSSWRPTSSRDSSRTLYAAIRSLMLHIVNRLGLVKWWEAYLWHKMLYCAWLTPDWQLCDDWHLPDWLCLTHTLTDSWLTPDWLMTNSWLTPNWQLTDISLTLNDSFMTYLAGLTWLWTLWLLVPDSHLDYLLTNYFSHLTNT